MMRAANLLQKRNSASSAAIWSESTWEGQFSDSDIRLTEDWGSLAHTVFRRPRHGSTVADARTLHEVSCSLEFKYLEFGMPQTVNASNCRLIPITSKPEKTKDVAEAENSRHQKAEAKARDRYLQMH